MAYAFVNEAHDFSFGASQPSLTLSVTKGNLIVAWLESAGPDPTGGSYGYTLYDSQNTYKPVEIPKAGGYGYLIAWVAVATRTATLTLDFFAYSTAGVIPGTGILQASRMNLSFPIAQVLQFSGNYGNPLLAFNYTTGSSTAPASSVTVAASPTLIVGIAIPAGGSSITNAAGWINAAGTNNSAIYNIEATAGTYTPTFITAPSSAWGCLALGFLDNSFPDYTISGSLGVLGAGATVVFVSTNLATVFTTTANGAGNYTSPALPNDTYVVIPELVGALFSPAQAEETVNGSNITGVNFTPTACNPIVVLTQTFSDTMIRANENPLSDGGNWTADSSEFPPGDYPCQLLSNECVMSNASIIANYAGPWTGDGISILTGASFPADQFAQFKTDVLAITGGATVQVRTGALDASSYDFSVSNNGDGTATFSIGGVPIPFSLPFLSPSGTQYHFTWQLTKPWAAGDTITLAAIGTILYMLHNGNVIGNYSDSAVTSGTGCISLGGLNISDAQVSHFIAGSATSQPAPPASGTANYPTQLWHINRETNWISQL